MRHGEAAPANVQDSLRPLTDHGCQQALDQAQDSNIPWQSLHQAFVSPYVRAQETFGIVQKALSFIGVVQASPLITPVGDPQKVQNWLMDCQQQDTLLVSHQPLLSHLIGFFCTADINQGHPMMPASVAVLSGKVFARGCMSLESLHHAE